MFWMTEFGFCEVKVFLEHISDSNSVSNTFYSLSLSFPISFYLVAVHSSFFSSSVDTICPAIFVESYFAISAHFTLLIFTWRCTCDFICIFRTFSGYHLILISSNVSQCRITWDTNTHTRMLTFRLLHFCELYECVSMCVQYIRKPVYEWLTINSLPTQALSKAQCDWMWKSN